MKISKTITTIVGLGLGVAAVQAQPTPPPGSPGSPVFITGSTAFRAQIFNALKDLNLTIQQGAPNNAFFFTATGTIADTTGGKINLSGASGVWSAYCSFNGSIEGVDNVIFGDTATYDDAASSGTFSTQGADLTFSDVAQTSCFQGTTGSDAD